MAKWQVCLVLALLCFLGAQGENNNNNNNNNNKIIEKGARGSAQVVFDLLDNNNNNKIELNELGNNNNNNILIQAEPEHGGSYEDKLQVIKAFNRMDSNQDGSISFDEFLNTIPSLAGDQSVHQVHLTLGSDVSEMLVMWVTDDNTTTSQVLIGTTSGSYSNSFLGSTSTYDVGELGGWHKTIHSVLVTGLSPATKYFYKCGDSNGGYSSEFSFTTPPPSSPTVYAMVGDMGTYIPMGWAVAKQLSEDLANFGFSLVVHAGDIAYAGTSSGGEIEEVWDVWASLVEPVASVVPYMVCIGNHEDYYNRTSFMHRFQMPTNGGSPNLWYSIDHGNVHWIFFSTQDDFAPGSPQYQWLEQDLIAANANRDKVAWIVFVTHRPMYCSDSDEIDQHEVGSQIQVDLEPILVQYGVDIFFCGHMHMYERVHPVINGTVVQTGNTYTSPKAPMHLVVGTAGAFTDHKYIDPQPAWSAVRNGEYGYGKLTVYNNSALHFSFMDESTKAATDEFWILK